VEPHDKRTTRRSCAASATTHTTVPFTGRTAALNYAFLFRYPEGYLQVTAVIMPALLALAEERNAPGAEVVSAYVVGVEVMCALGRALNHTHYERGWHPTATLGILATTAACARLSHLDHEQTARALGIAASFGSGLKGSFGTSMKSTQVGRPEAMSADAIASASCDRARSTARRAGRSEAQRTHWVASDPREPADSVEQCGAHVGNVRGVLQRHRSVGRNDPSAFRYGVVK
jgi:2-methylcitrate dehydratase PrpD